MRKVTEQTMEGNERNLIVADESMNKSDKIKALFDGGVEVKEIAELLGVRYNHAYNVIQNYVIVEGFEVEKSSRGTSEKRQLIEQMLKEGHRIIGVAKATKTVYNYVWKVSQELKMRDTEEEVVEEEQEVKEQKSSKKRKKQEQV